MDDVSLSRPIARSLREHIERRRRDLALEISGSVAGARGTLTGRSALIGGVLDRLAEELETGDRSAMERWVVEAAQEDWSREEGIVALSLALVASSYAAERGDGTVVARYLAARGKQLDRLFEDALSSVRSGPPPDERVARDEVVTSLLASLEARDFATCDHSRAVGLWAGRLAGALGTSREEQFFASLCGTLHDVGKLATPEAILLKPGPLDEDEWATMREHSAAGARILDRIPSLRRCSAVVRAHHERPDGSGYPDGLVSSMIPLAARVIAVADGFHAMISRRPYRPPMTVPSALYALNEGRGTRWDAAIVEALQGLLRSRLGHKLERAAGD